MRQQIFPRFVALFARGSRVRLTVGFARISVRQNFSSTVAGIPGTPSPLEGVVRNARISGGTQAAFVAGKCHCTRIGTSKILENNYRYKYAQQISNGCNGKCSQPGNPGVKFGLSARLMFAGNTAIKSAINPQVAMLEVCGTSSINPRMISRTPLMATGSKIQTLGFESS
jgi:hypothetical protein